MNSGSLLYLCKNILSSREKKIFYLYFGINCDPISFEEIANDFQVTRERIKQIFNKTISKIRNANFETFDNILEKAKKGFPIVSSTYNFDSELDDLTMAKICHKIYGKQCVIVCGKYLKHTWINNCGLKKALSDTLKYLKKSPIDPNINQILSYCSGDTESLDCYRRLLEDLVYFDKNSNTLSSLMSLDDRFEYLLDKYDGVVSAQEIMDNFSIDRDKARQLMGKGPCFTIGKTLCYSYRTSSILIQLVKALDYAGKPLSIEENCLYTIGIEFGFDKQKTLDAISSLIGSRPLIFTRINNKIALTEWYIKRKYKPHKKYTIKLLGAITEIIKNLESPATSIEILDLIRQKYGETVSHNLTSIRLSLKKLYESGKIGRIGTKNEYKYFLPKPLKK